MYFNQSHAYAFGKNEGWRGCEYFSGVGFEEISSLMFGSVPYEIIHFAWGYVTLCWYHARCRVKKAAGGSEESKAVLRPSSAVYSLVWVTKAMSCCLPEQFCPFYKPDQRVLPFPLWSLVTLK